MEFYHFNDNNQTYLHAPRVARVLLLSQKCLEIQVIGVLAFQSPNRGTSMIPKLEPAFPYFLESFDIDSDFLQFFFQRTRKLLTTSEQTVSFVVVFYEEKLGLCKIVKKLIF